ncbi:MAG TPA: tRNA (adenosine(37)-N6)-threonylcarbamoyltransferase complex ATPase subunit type 1 TsaE [Anaerolineae bacterium]|nr:tRNA (adenosine(37)-N6)-threonylcarbamoyltransferase complex ATPase subunit type 1 TsaE [Anaerolineae bacterium]
MSPILAPDVFEFVSGSPAQTMRIGERLGSLLQPGHVVCLAGALGTGKTCMAQGIGAGWGAAGEMTSPTFTLVHELRRVSDGATLYHIDLYRIESEDEARLLGLSDLFERDAVCLVEWPERAGDVLPDACLRVELITLDETRRRLTFSAEGERHLHLLSELKRAAFGVGE